MRRVFLSIMACVLAGNAYAGLITHNNYTLDTDTNIVTGGGLEWLQWDETLGLSINDVTDPNGSYAQAGWSVVNEQQMAALFNDWAFGPTGYVWGTDETVTQGISVFGATLPDVPSYLFTELFGATFTSSSGATNLRAIYGSDMNQNGLFVQASMFTSSGNPFPYGTVQLLEENSSISASYSAPSIAVAMVRDSSSVEVPEPGSLALMMIALGGLGLRRRIR